MHHTIRHTFFLGLRRRYLERPLPLLPLPKQLNRDGTGQTTRERHIEKQLTGLKTRSYATLEIMIIFFSSKQPRPTQERVKSLIFVPNRSTSVRGVHHHQAIVILASHVSSENLCCLHGTTMSDTNFHAYLANTATERTVYRSYFDPKVVKNW